MKDIITLSINREYKLSGIIGSPKPNHLNAINFNLIRISADSHFKSNVIYLIYYHDGLKNENLIMQLNEDQVQTIKLLEYLILIFKKN